MRPLMTLPARSFRIAALLFGSGLCALVYQVVWLRELRLVFGASTPATAVVLAVFMGGLGYGSLLLSPRADTVDRPLYFYAKLELFIAAAAGLSKPLLWVVRQAYIALGGSVALGWAGGTVVRLLLTALVLLPPTLAMGGTLPAAARAATEPGDESRRSTALLYGINTIGAVTGAALSTFVLLERLGAQATLLVAVLINGLVALAARELDRSLARSDRKKRASKKAAPSLLVVTGPPSSEVATTHLRDDHEATTERETAPAITIRDAQPRSDSDTLPEAEPAPETIDHPLMATLASGGPIDHEALPKPNAHTLPVEIAIVEAPSSPQRVAVTLPRESPLSRTLASPAEEEDQDISPFVLAAAAGVGFAFLVMELVWYRVLSPLLGGSSYTFGLILAVALAGIGIGGLIYTASSARADGQAPPALLSTFALTCLLEALCIAVPYALGDRVAFITLVLRDLGSLGLPGYLISWTLVAAIVVLPAAIVAGYQFPLLIALLGKDTEALGRHVGKAYAFNTLGAILGSLSGGFLLLPQLSALGAWRLSAWLLLILAAAALWLHDQARAEKPERPSRGLVVPLLLASATLACLHATVGPTAVWRHSPIGAGRADNMIADGTVNSVRAAFQERRRAISWMVDGRESSIGLYTLNDVSFMVNGKSDGAAINDGGTQVMGGLLGALLKTEPVERAMVIGLGSGSTAGWLGQLPTAERVDVVELEPEMQQVAAACAPVNRDVLANERVHIILGDAREVLLSTPNTYDLVFSEPSNPYRAGVASLFTKEFYEAVRGRLSEGGVFVQWLQAYEIDAKSLRMVYATLSSVFPSVETWRTKYSDLVLVSRMEDTPVDLALVRRRITEPPFQDALRSVWRVDSVEGVLSHFVARPGMARDIAAREGSRGINTDDMNALEFSIARALGRRQDFSVDDMLQVSVDRGEPLPEVSNGAIADLDQDAIYDAMTASHIAEAGKPYAPTHLPSTDERKRRFDALRAWHDNDHTRALKYWRAQTKAPESLIEVMVVADLLAVAGEEEEALPLIERLDEDMPIEANAIRAKLLWAKRKVAESWAPLREALIAYRTDPWPNNHLMSSVLAYLPDIAKSEPTLVDDILDVLATDLVMFSLHYYRVDLRLDISLAAGRPDVCVDALREVGPHFPWEEAFLKKRIDCFVLAGDARERAARADLAEFAASTGIDFGADLRPAASPSGSAP